jgi:hypothetical protein
LELDQNETTFLNGNLEIHVNIKLDDFIGKKERIGQHTEKSHVTESPYHLSKQIAFPKKMMDRQQNNHFAH